ncbi:MAG: hypothetical protein R3E99_02810 [Burkholderiaceae bacterium]
MASLYNQADNLRTTLNHSDWLPGNIGAQAGALSGVLTSLVSSIENDNALQALAGGIRLGNAVNPDGQYRAESPAKPLVERWVSIPEAGWCPS